MRVRRAIVCAALGLGLGVAAGAQGFVTGKFVLPTAGQVRDGTLLLQLSQTARLAGGYQLAPAQVACSTSIDGSVVGAPNPQAAPTGDVIPAAGTLPAGSYFLTIAYAGTNGEGSAADTLVSPEAAFTLNAAGEIVVHAPAIQPAAATGYAVYIGTTPGGETLQGTVTGWGNYTQSTPLGSGAAPAGTNGTACRVSFNDTIVPTGTYYEATLEDSAGNVLPGFPRGWYLAGGSADVGTLTPLASSPQVAFPEPILANPANPQTPQSINSELDLNGLPIHDVGNLGPGYVSFYWAGAAPAVGTALGTWTPNAAVWVRRIDVNAQAAGAGGTLGMTITLSDGTTTCTYGGQLIGAATNSTLAPLAGCAFNAGVPVTVRLAGDDHTSEPQGLNVMFEVTGK